MGRILRLGCICAIASALLAPAAHARGDSPQLRVIGGEAATVGQYPWQAAIASTGSGDAYWRQYCGGSLVASRIVITAAHCIDGDAPGEVSAILGRTRLSSGEGSEHAVIDVSIHPGYDAGTNEKDIGYLVLATPSAQEPIDIAGADEAAIWEPGRPAEVSGWGWTDSEYPDALMAAVVPVIADEVCADPAIYGGGFRAESMVCAGYLAGGVDTCSGDSGGPLQAPLEGGGYRLVGLTSWGYGCAEPNAPGVYSRVAGSGVRDAVVSELLALEQEHDLTHEQVIGSGGEPRTSEPVPTPTPTPVPVGGGPTGTAAGTGVEDERANPFQRCKRFKSKKKRRRCTRNVRRELA